MIPEENPAVNPGTPDTQEIDPDTNSENPDTPEVDPGTNPENPDTPEVDPGTNPENPDTPEVDPGTNPENQDTPEVDPGTNPESPDAPEVDPGTNPETPDTPGEDPVVEPETPVIVKIQIIEASQYDAIGSKKPFRVDALDKNDDVVDVSEMEVSYKWLVDGEVFNEDGKSEEAILYSDYDEHEISVTATIDGIEYTDTLTAKLRYIGPAGGYIFYDVDADNTAEDPDGRDNLLSTVSGWRYLEAAPSDLRVVDGVQTVDSTVEGYTDAKQNYSFGYYRTSDDGENLFVNGTTVYSNEDCTLIDIGAGEKNTELLSSAIGPNAYSYETGSETKSDYAARLCLDLSHGEYDDWFLPSQNELNLMYDNLKAEGIGSFANGNYWSSSEYLSTDSSRSKSFIDGDLWWHYRLSGNKVSPCRAF